MTEYYRSELCPCDACRAYTVPTVEAFCCSKCGEIEFFAGECPCPDEPGWREAFAFIGVIWVGAAVALLAWAVMP